MQRLTKILEHLPTPAYVVSVLDFTILVANRRADQLVPDMPGDLEGKNLVDVCDYHRIDFDTHPGVLARHAGLHTHYYRHRHLTVVASRLPDAPTRPPAVMITGRDGDEAPLAAAEHMRVMTNFHIASALDDVERSISVAHRMLVSGMERLHDVTAMWEERVLAYAESDPDPYAELALLDAVNVRSEGTSFNSVDVVSVVPSTVSDVSNPQPLTTGTGAW